MLLCILCTSAAVLALAACTPRAPDDRSAGDAVLQEQERSASSTATVQIPLKEGAGESGEAEKRNMPVVEPKGGGVYAEWTEEVIGNGETSVLFFHAGWCPVCKKADETLSRWYGGGKAPGMLSVYKVDFDASKDLRSRYGVTGQHTFVKIDGAGNVVNVLRGPTDPQLLGFLM